MDSDVCFDRAKDRNHVRIDSDRWRNIYVIGDVHGCRRELEDLLDRLSPGDDELLVFVGDLIRKGPDSRGVVRLVRDRHNAMSVTGNNEPKLFRGEESLPRLSDADRAYLRSLPLALSWEDHLVVHAGVDPDRSVDAQRPTELLNVRNPLANGDYEGPFWWEYYDGPPRIFFGHTPLDSPICRRYAVGLDTSCVYGGSLTAYDVGRDQFVSVPARETYQQRSDDEVVSPPTGVPGAGGS
jgi:serine/threonine protein phosphatase 1